jgi:hypothetical protein
MKAREHVPMFLFLQFLLTNRSTAVLFAILYIADERVSSVQDLAPDQENTTLVIGGLTRISRLSDVEAQADPASDHDKLTSAEDGLTES